MKKFYKYTITSIGLEAYELLKKKSLEKKNYTVLNYSYRGIILESVKRNYAKVKMSNHNPLKGRYW